MKNYKKRNQDVINERIREKEVRVVGLEGEALGVMSTVEALKVASEAGVDLVMISPNAKPPVVKVIDYGKYKYEKSRREKELKKKQNNLDNKEIRITPVIGANDLEIKEKRALEFLEKGHKVQFTMQFRGRMIANREVGKVVINDLIERMTESGEIVVDTKPRHEGRKLFVVFSPNKKKK